MRIRDEKAKQRAAETQVLTGPSTFAGGAVGGPGSSSTQDFIVRLILLKRRFALTCCRSPPARSAPTSKTPKRRECPGMIFWMPYSSAFNDLDTGRSRLSTKSFTSLSSTLRKHLRLLERSSVKDRITIAGK